MPAIIITLFSSLQGICTSPHLNQCALSNGSHYQRYKHKLGTEQRNAIKVCDIRIDISPSNEITSISCGTTKANSKLKSFLLCLPKPLRKRYLFCCLCMLLSLVRNTLYSLLYTICKENTSQIRQCSQCLGDKL